MPNWNWINRMKIAQYIVEYLKSKNIDRIFGYIGGYNADILDYFCEDKNNHFVLNYNEQASAFAINTYAELKEQVGVATASGAPSFCNLIGGIANAYFDSHPCVFIMGSAHSLAVRKDKSIRQNAFEEIDAVSMVRDITKYAVKITNPNEIKYELEKAFYIAKEGRKGPVLLDIPYDIIRSEIDIDKIKSFQIPSEPKYDEINFDLIIKKLKSAKRPVILLGGGARSPKSAELITKLTEKFKIPTVATLCGLDVLAHDNECFCGFIGHYGNRYANLALKNCDFMMILGSRLDERQLGGFRTTFSEDAFIVRVDIDKPELKRKLKENLSYFCPVEKFLENLVKIDFSNFDFTKWLRLISNWKERYPSLDEDKSNVSALNFLNQISDYLPDDAIICADVGQNQMLTAQAIKLNKKRRLFNSCGYGSMGFSLPAAIGCAFAKPNTCVVSVNGDGGIQMNIQELQTLRRDNLAVNIIVLNNKCLGMIRKTQEKLFDGKDFVSVKGYEAPNFEPIAKAYDISYLRVDRVEDYTKVKDFLSQEHPTFIEVCLPMLIENNPEPGACIEMQTTILSDEDFETIEKELRNL